MMFYENSIMFTLLKDARVKVDPQAFQIPAIFSVKLYEKELIQASRISTSMSRVLNIFQNDILKDLKKFEGDKEKLSDLYAKAIKLAPPYRKNSESVFDSSMPGFANLEQIADLLRKIKLDDYFIPNVYNQITGVTEEEKKVDDEHYQSVMYHKRHGWMNSDKGHAPNSEDFSTWLEATMNTFITALELSLTEAWVADNEGWGLIMEPYFWLKQKYQKERRLRK
jgi:Txe/YoeB family toxin of Txe-Axe toxin-antitoxin module